MAFQLLVSRAVARNFAKNEKEKSFKESLGTFFLSLVRRLGGAVVERTSQKTPRQDIDTRTLDSRRRSVDERNSTISSVRRSLLDSVLRRVTNHQAVQLRKKAFDQLTLNGNSAPFLALVGVSLG